MSLPNFGSLVRNLLGICQVVKYHLKIHPEFGIPTVTHSSNDIFQASLGFLSWCTGGKANYCSSCHASSRLLPSFCDLVAFSGDSRGDVTRLEATTPSFLRNVSSGCNLLTLNLKDSAVKKKLGCGQQSIPCAALRPFWVHICPGTIVTTWNLRKQFGVSI